MRRGDMIGDLLRRASLTAPDLLVADVSATLQEAGGHHLVLYIVDYEQLTLQPVGIATDLLDEEPKGVTVEGTLAGRAYQLQQLVTAQVDDGWRVWAPVRERAERIGVLEFGFPEIDGELLTLCDDLGLLTGHLVHTAGRYTDLVELRRRRRPMNLAAEMQWDMLMPPLAFSSPELAIAGILEPAYFVAGDAFDYSLNGDLFNFAVLDAMGHGVHSTLASTLALGAFRHGRRRGLELTVVAEQIDDALREQFRRGMLRDRPHLRAGHGNGNVQVGQCRPPRAAARPGLEGGRRADRRTMPAARARHLHRGGRAVHPPTDRPDPLLLGRRHGGPTRGRPAVRGGPPRQRGRGVHGRQPPGGRGAAAARAPAARPPWR